MPAIPSQEILDTVDGRGSRFLLRFVSIKLEMSHVHQRFPVRRPTLVAVVRGSLAGHEAGDRILGRIKLKELGTTCRCGEGRKHDTLPGWMPCDVPVVVASDAQDTNADTVGVLLCFG